MEELLAPKHAGELLDGITTSAVGKLARNGQLREIRDSAGRRLFRRKDVLRLKAKRDEAARRRAAVA